MVLLSDDIASMERRFRATFLNSLSGARQAALLGTISASGITNLALFSSLVHVGADPPLWGLLFRPDTVPRHSLANIEATGSFSLNYVPLSRIRDAHQTSAKYPADVSEFDSCGFTPGFRPDYAAPVVEESPVRIILKPEEKISLVSNGTIFLVGRIMRIECDVPCADDGFAELTQAGIASTQGLDAWLEMNLVSRFPYARP
jgi:flavin reductase (DIM6/NTAB) family NADH-FMN oxidoreductase RutF